MTSYTLYCFRQSGHAYKAALMLNLCGARWKPRWVDFFKGGETKTPAYRATVNEQGEVPVLEWDGGRLTQSGVILDYLSEKYGKYRWRNDDERREVYRWLFWDNHKLTSYTATYRFFITLQKTGETPVTEFLRGRSRGALDILNKHLANSKFAVGERPTIADVSMCGYLYWPDEFGVKWETDYPHIGRWLDDIKALPGWEHPYKLLPDGPV